MSEAQLSEWVRILYDRPDGTLTFVQVDLSTYVEMGERDPQFWIDLAEHRYE